MVPAVTRRAAVVATPSGALSASVTTVSSSACEGLGQTETEMNRTVPWGPTRLEKLGTMGFHSDRPRLLAECPIR